MDSSTQPLQFAFFDVDGTVIAKDSFQILMRNLLFKDFPFRLLVAAFLCFTLALLWPFGRLNKTQVKSALLWSATVGLPRKTALLRIRTIVNEKIKPLWFREMNEELTKLRAEGLRICYVSASGEYWLKIILNEKDPDEKVIVGSRLMSFFGGLTLRGRNCLGPEKIRRLKKIIPKEAEWVVAYSDHRADIPLLRASRQRVAVNPTLKNLKAFQKSFGDLGFSVVQWHPEHKN